MSDGGKGSSPRPYSVNQDQFANNWDAIFGKKTKGNVDNNIDQVYNNERLVSNHDKESSNDQPTESNQ